MRQQLVKFRTAQINRLRGLLTEYGEAMPQGRAGMRKAMPDALARVPDTRQRDEYGLTRLSPRTRGLPHAKA